MPHEPTQLNKPERIPILSDALKEKIRSLFSALSEQASRDLAGLAPGARAPAVRAAAGDGRDRRAAGDHARPRCTTR